MDVDGERPPSSPKRAWSSDGSWVACDESPRNTAAQENVSEDSFVTVNDSGTHPSPTSTGRVPHYRPGHLDYTSQLSSEGEYCKQGGINVYSPSSPQTYRQGFSMTPTASSPPKAAPRGGAKVKQLEEEVAKLRQQLAQKEDQNMKLREANGRNVDRMTEQISRLELSSTSADQTIMQLKHQLREKEEEVDKERREIRQLELSMESLKKEHAQQRRQLEEERDKLKEQVKRTPTTEQVPPLGRSNSSANVSRRLNDALCAKKKLEEEITALKQEVNELKTVNERAREDNERLNEENERIKHEQLARADQEKQLLQQQLEEQGDELREAKQNVEWREREINTLQEECARINQQHQQQLQESEERADEQLSDYQTRMESYLAEKDTELKQVKLQVEKLSAEKESLEMKIESLESDFESLISRNDQEKNALQTQLQQAKVDRDKAQEARNKVAGDLAVIKDAKKKGETLQDALKKEAEYIMTDLEEVNDKLRAAEQERDKVTHQKDKAMNELAKRNQEIQQRDQRIAELKKHLEEKKEQMTILDFQLKTYHSDFETERKSREQMAGTVDQLKSELHKKEMEVKRLHSHLNRSAANQMKAEMEFLTSQEGVGDYATVQSPPPMGSDVHQPLRARDPERTYGPPHAHGGQYQMHTPRHQ